MSVDVALWCVGISVAVIGCHVGWCYGDVVTVAAMRAGAAALVLAL